MNKHTSFHTLEDLQNFEKSLLTDLIACHSNKKGRIKINSKNITKKREDRKDFLQCKKRNINNN
jgi:hypothetical protein